VESIGQSIHGLHRIEVLQAGSADQVIDLCRSHNPAMVLLELMMPGLDSFTAAEEIRKIRPDR
jgi:DNA-binding NarL/FixJ family response regulator